MKHMSQKISKRVKVSIDHSNYPQLVVLLGTCNQQGTPGQQCQVQCHLHSHLLYMDRG